MENASGSAQVWLVEDDVAFRTTLQLFLQHERGFRCDQLFGSVEDAVEAVRALQRVGVEEGWPDLVVLDVSLPGRSGTEGLPVLRSLLPGTTFVMLTLHEDAPHIFAALEAGASGYVTKGSSLGEVSAILRDALGGGMSLPPPVARLMRTFFWSHRAPVDYGLTHREHDVLEGMVEGFSQKEIAARLNVSVATVNTHIKSLYAKLHVHNGTAAVSKALRERLL